MACAMSMTSVMSCGRSSRRPRFRLSFATRSPVITICGELPRLYSGTTLQGSTIVREGAMRRSAGRHAALMAVFALLAPNIAHADPVADFYRGKNFALLIRAGPGGG